MVIISRIFRMQRKNEIKWNEKFIDTCSDRFLWTLRNDFRHDDETMDVVQNDETHMRNGAMVLFWTL